MKKFFNYFFIAAFLSATLISCEKEEDDTDDTSNPPPPTSSVFGAYGCPLVSSVFVSTCTQGAFNSDGEIVRIVIPRENADDLGINDEVLTDRPLRFEAIEISGIADSIDVVVTLSVTLGNTLVPVPVPLRVGYNATTKTFTRTNVEVSIDPTGIPNTTIEAKLVSLDGTFGENNDFTAVMVLDDWDSSSDNNINATLYLRGTK